VGCCQRDETPIHSAHDPFGEGGRARSKMEKMTRNKREREKKKKKKRKEKKRKEKNLE